MKRLLYLLIVLSIYSCKKDCILNYEIIGPEYPSPFITVQNELFKKFDPDIDYDVYKPINVNEYEIPYIMEMIKTKITEHKRATDRIKNEICNYSVQISGFYYVRSKTKKIYLIFDYGYIDFEGNKELEKKLEKEIDNELIDSRYLDVMDGGDTFFTVIINTKTNTIHNFHINGEA